MTHRVDTYRRIRSVLKESLNGKELVSSDTYTTITTAIAEYGHMMSGENYTLGELARKIEQNLSETEQMSKIVQTLNRFSDKHIEDLIENNGTPDQTYYDRYAVMPPEWAPKFAVTGQDPPKSAGI